MLRPVGPRRAVTEQPLDDLGVRRLPDEQQLVIELRYWEELTLAEIAEVMEVPLNTVKTRLHRARTRLAKEIELLESKPEVRESTLSRMEHWVTSIRARR